MINHIYLCNRSRNLKRNKATEMDMFSFQNFIYLSSIINFT